MGRIEHSSTEAKLREERDKAIKERDEAVAVAEKTVRIVMGGLQKILASQKDATDAMEAHSAVILAVYEEAAKFVKEVIE